MRPIIDIRPLLEQPRRIFITTHQKPDADALGSSLGLYHYLTLKGHTVTVVSPTEFPDFLQWMPGMQGVLNFEKQEAASLKVLAEADILFCLDFNHADRTKKLAPHLLQATQPKVLIDHHMQPAPDFDYGQSDTQKSSTCEMVYDFINLMGDNALINLDMAQCLYAGCMTDTGSFRFPSTTASVHRMIADFKDRGLNHASIHEQVYDNSEERRLRFLGFALSQRMEVFPEKKAALIAISKEDARRFNLDMGDTEGLVNYPLGIKGIVFSTFITEKADEVKMSFRSKGSFDVNTFARTHFDGGGHFNAAGGRSDIGFQQTVEKFKTILKTINI